MPATAARAAFVLEEFRSAIWQNQNVRNLYGRVARDTKDAPIPTFFDDMWAVQAMVNERGALLGRHARAFRVAVGDLMDLAADLDMGQALPCARIISNELVADFDVAVSALEYDTENRRTSLAVWGICETIEDDGNAFDWVQNLVPEWIEALRSPSGELPIMASDFMNGRYWLGGQEVQLSDVLEDRAGFAGDFSATSIISGKGMNNAFNTGTPCFTAAAAAVMGTEVSMLVAGKMSATSEVSPFFYDAAAYALHTNVAGGSRVGTYDDPASYELTPDAAPTNARTVMAATLSSAYHAVSVDGDAVLTTALPAHDTNWNHWFLMSPNKATDYLEMAVVWPVLPNADLQTLSGTL